MTDIQRDIKYIKRVVEQILLDLREQISQYDKLGELEQQIIA